MFFFSDERIGSKKYSYLLRENKKRSVEMYSVASGGDQGKYMKYVNFPWTPLVVTLSIFNAVFLLKESFQGINKNKGDCHHC
jgi:hypothetical protein